MSYLTECSDCRNISGGRCWRHVTVDDLQMTVTDLRARIDALEKAGRELCASVLEIAQRAGPAGLSITAEMLVRARAAFLAVADEKERP